MRRRRRRNPSATPAIGAAVGAVAGLLGAVVFGVYVTPGIITGCDLNSDGSSMTPEQSAACSRTSTLLLYGEMLFGAIGGAYAGYQLGS